MLPLLCRYQLTAVNSRSSADERHRCVFFAVYRLLNSRSVDVFPVFRKSFGFNHLIEVRQENIFPAIFLPCFQALFPTSWQETQEFHIFFENPFFLDSRPLRP